MNWLTKDLYSKAVMAQQWLCLALLFSCAKEIDSLNETSVINISPQQGPKGAQVVILGNNFGDSNKNIEVLFNNKASEILEVTNNELTVIVPEMAGTGPVSVSVNGRNASRKPEFNYLLSASSYIQTYGDFMTIDPSDNLYFIRGHQILKVSPQGSMTLFAGQTASGYQDGPASSAQFYYPMALFVDGQGNVLVADGANNRIRKISTTGTVSTVAGTGATGFVKQYADGDALTEAKFYFPTSIAQLSDGSLIVADNGNNRIRKILPSGEVITLAGNDIEDIIDGTGAQASFFSPGNLLIGQNETIYLSDGATVRTISATSEVQIFAGSKESGYKNGIGTNARFRSILSLSFNKEGHILVADDFNHRIRKISQIGEVTTFAGIGETIGVTPEVKFGTLDQATFWGVHSISVGSDGTVYAGCYDGIVRKIN
jgi:hypothetical protein